MAAGTAVQIAQGSGNIAAGGHRTRETTYRVITTDPYDGTAVVQGASGLPTIGQVYGESDLGCVCVALIPERVSRYVWHVTAVFSTEYESIAAILNEPPDVSFPSEPGEEAIIGQSAAIVPTSLGDQLSTDPNAKQGDVPWLAGKGIVNSAGTIYDPPATRRITRPLVRISRNERTFSLAYKLQYENSVNRASWNGLNARQAFCRNIDAQAMYFTPPTYTLTRQLYWRVSYEFVLKFETHDLVLPDAGPYRLEYSGSTAYRKAFTGPDGTPFVGLLDHTTDPTKPGQKLADGADVQYRRWRINREMDFNGMNLTIDLSLPSLMPTARGFRPYPDPSKTPISVA